MKGANRTDCPSFVTRRWSHDMPTAMETFPNAKIFPPQSKYSKSETVPGTVTDSRMLNCVLLICLFSSVRSEDDYSKAATEAFLRAVHARNHDNTELNLCLAKRFVLAANATDDDVKKIIKVCTASTGIVLLQ